MALFDKAVGAFPFEYGARSYDGLFRADHACNAHNDAGHHCAGDLAECTG